ncbi:MAG: shikimate kinase [Acidobacteria bacterium]|nr:shikimate kinase [Acidobacteriota bacterium]
MSSGSSSGPSFLKSLYLVGFMGCGKTTVGLRLARRLAWRFVDLDQRIEQEAGMSIAEIFGRGGEPAFRQREHALVRGLLEENPEAGGRVVALGGGTFAQPQNFDLLQRAGAITIWLECPVEILLMRCALVTNRPLFRDEDSFRQLYEQRLPYYQQATFTVQTGQADPDKVVSQILALVSLREEECKS